jgi:peroxiredoxin
MSRSILAEFAPRVARPKQQRARTLAQLVPLLIAVMLSWAGASAYELEPWSGQDPGLFTLPNLSRSEVALSAYRGRPVIVHFFATWCESCREEMESLRRFVARAGNQQLPVLAISVGEPDGRVRRFFDTIPVNFPVLLDRDKAIARSWRVATLPTSYVLDAELQPKLFVRGDFQWDRLDIAQTLRKLDATQ